VVQRRLAKRDAMRTGADPHDAELAA
jgi:hypothetical protein